MNSLEHILEEIGHLLPTQGPLEVFVHHNTLHAFEESPFLESIENAAAIFGARAYMPEWKYRAAFAKGRISENDLRAELLKCGDEAPMPLSRSVSAIRALLLSVPGGRSRESIGWELLDSGALNRPLPGLAGPRWDGAVANDISKTWQLPHDERSSRIASLVERHPFWNEDDETIVRELESLMVRRRPNAQRVALRMLWLVCLGLSRYWEPRGQESAVGGKEEREIYIHELISPILTKLVAAFVDRGMAQWELPRRECGFLSAALDHFARNSVGKNWVLGGIDEYVRRFEGMTNLGIIEAILDSRGIAEEDVHPTLLRVALRLKGWAGYMQLIAHRGDICALPESARQAAYYDFMAIALLLESFANHRVLEAGICSTAFQPSVAHNNYLDRLYTRAYHLFGWSQILGMSALQLAALSAPDSEDIKNLFVAWDERRRQRVWHLAFERTLERRTYEAVLARASHPVPVAERPKFQVICCIDDREESFRRYLEGMGSHIVTYGTAGFFGVDIEFQDIEQNRSAFCPVVITPKHRVTEVPAQGKEHTLNTKQRMQRGVHISRSFLAASSRTAFPGLAVALAGSLAVIPMGIRTIFPRINHFFSEWSSDDATEVLYHRSPTDQEFSSEIHLGFTVEEMVTRVSGLLKGIGLVHGFAPLVVLFGHGSSSKNNPFRSAYDCGACGGRPGRINSRVFALMANRPDVRGKLIDLGFDIPNYTHFIGGYHDTCNDAVVYFDADAIPKEHRQLFAELKEAVDAARRRNAGERVRRFGYTAPRDAERALLHVEGRSHHIAEPRPEYGHATNAICIVGRRTHTRGVFLDRRSFLVSYDPTIDGQGTILQGLLTAVIPVCMGINLEYFFSAVDNNTYGAGTKLPLNVSALIGTITGYSSDLRTGLPAQMVEIHEPVRLITIIDSSVAMVATVLERVPNLKRIIHNEWVRAAVYDAELRKIFRITPEGIVEASTLDKFSAEEVTQEFFSPAASQDNLPFFPTNI